MSEERKSEERKSEDRKSEGKKTALITGASRGIGRAIALGMAQKGYDLHLTARNSYDLLAAVKEEIAAISASHCEVSLCDASSEAQVGELFSRIGALDILVNNAGMAYSGLLSEMSAADWKSVIDTNLSGVFHNCKAAIPAMVARKSGRIINISSVWGMRGASCEAAYSASKAGVIGLTRALAKELAPSGIAVNCIAPGLIDTEMNKNLTAEELRVLYEKIPCNRAGRPEEVAEVALFLAEAPLYLTGQVIGIDGACEL